MKDSFTKYFIQQKMHKSTLDELISTLIQGSQKRIQQWEEEEKRMK